jgi:hypothetical protein
MPSKQHLGRGVADSITPMVYLRQTVLVKRIRRKCAADKESDAIDFSVNLYRLFSTDKTPAEVSCDGNSMHIRPRTLS